MRFAGITLANYMDGQDESMMAKTGIQTRGQERMSGNKAQYQTELAEAGASATMAQGQAAGQASMFSGIASGVSSLAGGAIQGANKPPTVGVPRTSPGPGIPGSVAPSYNGVQRPYYGPAF